MFGRTLFGGSRFLFWSLAPFLMLFVVAMAWLVPDWTSRGGLLVAALIAAALLLLLQLYDRVRFHWAGRVLAGLVFVAYAAYLLDELAPHAARARRRTLVLEALAGLLVIGVPAGLYALLGRWTLREDENTRGSTTDDDGFDAAVARFGWQYDNGGRYQDESWDWYYSAGRRYGESGYVVLARQPSGLVVLLHFAATGSAATEIWRGTVLAQEDLERAMQTLDDYVAGRRIMA